MNDRAAKTVKVKGQWYTHKSWNGEYVNRRECMFDSPAEEAGKKKNKKEYKIGADRKKVANMEKEGN